MTTLPTRYRISLDTMVTLNWQQQKLRNEKISRAIEAQRLKDAGWSDGDLMNHFGVSSRSLSRWFKFLSEKVPTGGDKG